MLARFDIVLVAFPFTDGPNVKPRPAMVICLSQRHQDWRTVVYDLPALRDVVTRLLEP
jgi:hypothetical protein